MLATETIQLPGVSIVVSAAVAILGLILAGLFNSAYSAFFTQVLHHPLSDQESIPLIRYALSTNPLVAALAIVVVAPASEEIIFRGLFFGAIEGRWGARVALIVSSILFAVAHVQPEHIVPIFSVGLALGWARWKTGSLGLPMLLHMLNNGLSLILLAWFDKGG